MPSEKCCPLCVGRLQLDYDNEDGVTIVRKCDDCNYVAHDVTLEEKEDF